MRPSICTQCSRFVNIQKTERVPGIDYMTEDAVHDVRRAEDSPGRASTGDPLPGPPPSQGEDGERSCHVALCCVIVCTVA